MNLGRISNDARAIRTLASWLGEGGNPVDIHIAEERARTCISCPHNTDAKTVERTIGKIIRDSEKVRQAIGARLPDESKLRSCSICGCYLPLKIWVPFKHLSQTQTAVMPAHCWVTRESNHNAGVP